MESKELEAHRPMLMRVNRALGTALVEHKLVTPEQLESANARLLDTVKTGDLKQANLLGLLLIGNESVKEAALIQYQVETLELGLINLTTYNIERSVDPAVDIAMCYVTRTIPYERQEEFVMLATNLYLSEPVKKYWQEQYPTNQLIWSVASTVNMNEALERLENRVKK